MAIYMWHNMWHLELHIIYDTYSFYNYNNSFILVILYFYGYTSIGIEPQLLIDWYSTSLCLSQILPVTIFFPFFN